jgi:hypothetical protein
MRTFGKLVVVVAILVALGAGLYLGGKGLLAWGATSPDEAYATLLDENISRLERLTASDERRAQGLRDALKVLGEDLPDSKRLHFGILSGYLEMYLTERQDTSSALQALKAALKTPPVNRTDFEQMQKDLETLAAQEFRTEDKTRADVLRRYKK